MRILEEDDGSGWVKAMDPAGVKGLVPASYLESVDTVEDPQQRTSPPRGSAQGHGQQGSGKYGKRASA